LFSSSPVLTLSILQTGNKGDTESMLREETSYLVLIRISLKKKMGRNYEAVEHVRNQLLEACLDAASSSQLAIL